MTMPGGMELCDAGVVRPRRRERPGEPRCRSCDRAVLVVSTPYYADTETGVKGSNLMLCLSCREELRRSLTVPEYHRRMRAIARRKQGDPGNPATGEVAVEKPRWKRMPWSNEMKELGEGKFVKIGDGESRVLTFRDDGVVAETPFKDDDGNPIRNARFSVDEGGKVKEFKVGAALLRVLQDEFEDGVSGLTIRIARKGTGRNTVWFAEEA